MTKSFDLVKQAIVKNQDSLFHCFVKLDRHTVKKNSRPIKRRRDTFKPYIGKSDKLVGAEMFMTAHFRKALMALPGFEVIKTPVWAVFLFYFPVTDFVVQKGKRRGQISGRLPDLSNLIELPQDSLQKAGIIENDRLICSLDLSRRLPSDSHALEVFLFPYQIESTKHLRAVT